MAGLSNSIKSQNFARVESDPKAEIDLFTSNLKSKERENVYNLGPVELKRQSKELKPKEFSSKRTAKKSYSGRRGLVFPVNKTECQEVIENLLSDEQEISQDQRLSVLLEEQVGLQIEVEEKDEEISEALSYASDGKEELGLLLQERESLTSRLQGKRSTSISSMKRSESTRSISRGKTGH